MNPFDVLAPNYLGDQNTNVGLDLLRANVGWGSDLINPPDSERDEEEKNPFVKNVRKSSARQFGKNMENVF